MADSQMGDTPSLPVKRSGMGWLRLLGPALLILLLSQMDVQQAGATFLQADRVWVTLSTVLILPLIALKTVRWQGILRAQSIRYRFWPAYVAYFASLFVGFLTPGRLGEFTKALYVWHDGKSDASQQISFASALSGVIADRIFDLGAVIIVSLLALANLAVDIAAWLALLAVCVLLAGGFVLLLHPGAYSRVQRLGLRLGKPGIKLFAEDGWVSELRLGLIHLRGGYLLAAILFTAVAYGLYFGQCHLLALALDLPLSYLQVCYVVALGGLVTLLPVSISGLGTREATMVAYLATMGISAEASLGFSLLVFATFYLGGCLIGAIAWLLRPTPAMKRTG